MLSEGLKIFAEKKHQIEGQFLKPSVFFSSSEVACPEGFVRVKISGSKSPMLGHL
jgi:hypothetical protein